MPSRSRLSLPVILLGAALSSSTSACIRDTIPDPRQAANAYANAAARGDADAIYEMLDENSRRTITREELRRLVADQRAELADQAKAILHPDTEVKAVARVRYADGEDAILELKDGRFLIASSDALPAGAKSPAQALDQLRRVLARRSYSGLLRVLSEKTRAAIENDLRSLVNGLENPEALDIQQTGDSVTVRIPGGHLVRLRREAGTWRVEDFN